MYWSADNNILSLVNREDLSNSSTIVLVVLAAVFGGLVVFQWKRNRALQESRDGALVRVAHGLGLEFHLGRNVELPNRYGYIQRLSQGSGRHATNVMTGSYRGYPVVVFDHHYTTTSERNAGLEDSPVHHTTVFVVHVTATFPELIIAGDGPFTSLAQSSGHAGVTFESREFSDQYYVESGDKKFAYAICHPLMMEFLLTNPVPTLEFERDTIVLTLNRLLKPERIQSILDRLIGIRALVPDYLLNET